MLLRTARENTLVLTHLLKNNQYFFLTMFSKVELIWYSKKIIEDWRLVCLLLYTNGSQFTELFIFLLYVSDIFNLCTTLAIYCNILARRANTFFYFATRDANSRNIAKPINALRTIYGKSFMNLKSYSRLQIFFWNWVGYDQTLLMLHLKWFAFFTKTRDRSTWSQNWINAGFWWKLKHAALLFTNFHKCPLSHVIRGFDIRLTRTSGDRWATRTLLKVRQLRRINLLRVILIA